jgi:Protein of unknown function (DUF3631)
VWWALLSIAELAGGEWPARARKAAKELASGGDAVDELAEQTQLLHDIRDVFGDVREVVFTKTLLADLNALDESPWGAKRKGEGLDARGLAKLLRPFRIKSRTVRIGDITAKGYHAEQFADAFARYLPTPPEQASQASRPSQPSPDAERDVADVTDVTDFPGVPGRRRPPCSCASDAPLRVNADGVCERCGGVAA